MVMLLNRNIAELSTPFSAVPTTTRTSLVLFLAFSAHLLFVEPYVFHAVAVVHAVDHDRESLDVGSPASCAGIVVDNWSCAVLLEPAVNLPYQSLSPLLIRLHRLLFEQLLSFAITIASVVAIRFARIVLIKLLVRIIDATRSEKEGDNEMLAGNVRKPVPCLNRVEFA